MYICIYVYIYIYNVCIEETNVLWRVLANERRAHRRCSGTDRGTAARRRGVLANEGSAHRRCSGTDRGTAARPAAPAVPWPLSAIGWARPRLLWVRKAAPAEKSKQR